MMIMRGNLTCLFLAVLFSLATADTAGISRHNQRQVVSKPRGSRPVNHHQRHQKERRLSSHDDDDETTTSHGNIFDHHSGDEVEVACGSDDQPFLTTFVTSLQFRTGGGGGSSGSKKGSMMGMSGSSSKSSKGGMMMMMSSSSSTSGSSGKGKGGRGRRDRHLMSSSGKGSGKGGTMSSSSTKEDDSDDEEYEEDDLLLPDGPANSLTREEQGQLEVLFREVYNQMSFGLCDGFFRTVFTTRMTRDESSSTLDVTDDDFTMLARNGDERRLNATNGGFASELFATVGRQSGYWAANTDENDSDNGNGGGADDDAQNVYQDDEYGGGNGNANEETDDYSIRPPTNGDGDGDMAVYFVSLTATCRNCRVTPEVNFPLLRIPEAEMVAATIQNSSQGVVAPSNSNGNNSTDTCTCPVEAVPSEALAADERRKKRKRRRHLAESQEAWHAEVERHLQTDDALENNGSDVLFHPPPKAPTAKEFIDAMNAAIRENDALDRIEGLVRLTEPDYFGGINPTRDPVTAEPTTDGSPTVSPAPTVAALTRPPAPLTPAPTSVQDNPDAGGSSGVAVFSRTMTAAIMVVSLLLSAVLL